MQSRHFTDIASVASDDLEEILSLAVVLKERAARGISERALAGKVLALIFEKPSLRTRVSFEVGMSRLGGTSVVLHRDEIGLGERESVKDTARVLSRFVNGIMLRTFSHSKVEELARHSEVPVINGLSDGHHPCQAIADVLTLRQRWGDAGAGRKVAFIGDGNNVARSLGEICAKLGIRFACAAPTGFQLEADTVAGIRAFAPEAAIELSCDPREAVAGADAVYTDTWISMGQEEQSQTKVKAFAGFQVNASLMAAAKADAVFLHCLPAHRGMEVTDEVIDGPASAVEQQAENRMHAQSALVRLLLGGPWGAQG